MLAPKKLRSTAAVIAVCILFLGSAYAATSNWWHGLSQSQRNARIVERARQDIGDDVGLQCKAWVQQVVWDASNQTVYPPPNSGNYQWQTSPDVRAMSMPYPAHWCTPGQIIQMRWRNTNGTSYTHTAIVESKTSNGMYWIDSNWSGDERVQRHFVSYSQFDSRVGTNYTVYEIR